jgi:hypothetical protein
MRVWVVVGHLRREGLSVAPAVGAGPLPAECAWRAASITGFLSFLNRQCAANPVIRVDKQKTLSLRRRRLEAALVTLLEAERRDDGKGGMDFIIDCILSRLASPSKSRSETYYRCER